MPAMNGEPGTGDRDSAFAPSPLQAASVPRRKRLQGVQVTRFSSSCILNKKGEAYDTSMSTQTTKSEYLVLCRGIKWDKSLSPEEIRDALSQLYAWFERLTNEGKIKGVRRLAEEGKILTGGKAVTDGPFPESKEAIAGYWVIQADSLEEAVEITKGNPLLQYGETVEVRPILPEGSTL
jgi:hypothetical protein